MGQVKMKFKKIHETLDGYEISRPDECVIDSLFTLYRNLHHIVRIAKDADEYGFPYTKKFYAVSKLQEKIESLVTAASFNPVKALDKKMFNLRNRVLCKAYMIEAAFRMIENMSSLEQDPLFNMTQVIYSAEFEKDIKKLKRRMKEHVLKVIANSPEKPNVDCDKRM